MREGIVTTSLRPGNGRGDRSWKVSCRSQDAQDSGGSRARLDDARGLERCAQRGPQLRHAGEARAAIARERSGDHLRQPHGEIGTELLCGVGAAKRDRLEQRFADLAVERPDAGHHLVEKQPATVDVGALVEVAPALDLLWREVHRSADHESRLREPMFAFGVRLPIEGRAKVEQLDEPSVVAERNEQDVARLQVTVQKLLLVGGREPARHLVDDPRAETEIERRFSADARGERLAGEQAHDEIGAPVGEPPEIVDRADVGVVERPCDARFALQPPGRVRGADQLGQERLHGDGSPKAEVVGLEHLRRSAGAKERCQTVAAVEEQTNARALVGDAVHAEEGVQRAGASERGSFTCAPVRRRRKAASSPSTRAAWPGFASPHRSGVRWRAWACVATASSSTA